jgi:hypothetical protein
MKGIGIRLLGPAVVTSHNILRYAAAGCLLSRRNMHSSMKTHCVLLASYVLLVYYVKVCHGYIVAVMVTFSYPCSLLHEPLAVTEIGLLQ